MENKIAVEKFDKMCKEITELFRLKNEEYGGAYFKKENASQWFYEIKRKYIEKGVIADDGAEWAWGAEMNEQGRFAHIEELFMYDPADAASAKGAAEFIEETSLLTAKQAPGLAIWELARGGLGPKAHDIYGPACSNYHIWQRRIKKAFDPNFSADATFYIDPEE